LASQAANESEQDPLELFVFFDEAVDERDEFFAGAGKDEGPGCGIPVEFETGGEGRDPDLANRGIGSDDELGGWFFKDDVEDAVLLFDFEAGGPLSASPAIASGRLVIGSQDGKLFCLG